MHVSRLLHISSLGSKFLISFLAFGAAAAFAGYIVQKSSKPHPNTPHAHSPSPTPTQSAPPAQPTESTPTPASGGTYVLAKCVGADGKISYVTKALCDTVKGFWDTHPPAPNPKATAQAASTSSSSGASYASLGLFGTSLSGLEFDGAFEANTLATYTYFSGKGFNVIRLPFSWDELQPDLYGNLDSTQKGYIDENIAWAKASGMKVILDMHNYGRRYVYRDGGFTDDFANSTQRTFRIPYGDHDATNATLTLRDFGRALAGTVTDPVSPAASYKITVDAKINSTDGHSYDQFYIEPYYVDSNNKYSFYINHATGSWLLRKVISGTQTTLASGSHTWTLGQYYTFVIDVNQATSGKINISVDGTPLFTTDSVNSDPSLTHGYVSMYPSGTNTTIKNFTLNVNGDTTNGGPIQQRVTDSLLPVAAWSDFWQKLASAYKNDTTVIGYDENEPHDMPIPTTTNNYSAAVASANGVSESTVTTISQAMLNAIRGTGDTHYVVVEMDSYDNTHRFTTAYGSNPSPWVIDSLSPARTIYSGHYYFDSNHSGTYSDDTVPSNATIDAEVTPFFSWCDTQNVQCLIGEYGVPNTSKWQPTLTHFLDLMKTYKISSTQWAGGNLYSSITTLQPTSSYTVDRLQMNTISDFLNQ